MENATDALLMAGSVLMFIIALTVAISSFTSLRGEMQTLLNERDQLLIMKDEDTGGYINYLKSDNNDKLAIRTVGIDAVITSIRRMTKEDYTVYIEPIDNLEDFNATGSFAALNVSTTNKQLIKLSIAGIGDRYVSKDNLTNVLSSIYKKLKNKKFEEYIGIYQNKTTKGVADANKSTYKIVTYKEKN